MTSTSTSMKVLFWNIEKFEASPPARLEEVLKHVNSFNPDLFCFCEIKDRAAIRSAIQSELSGYDFGVTDHRGPIELVAGWRRGFFEQVIFTQRREFQAASPNLRPGSLVSVKRQGKFYNFLFLHTDSGTQNKDYTNRQTMFEKVFHLHEKLAQLAPNDDSHARLVVMGDLNTMGCQSPNVSAAEEIAALRTKADRAGMVLLDKTHPATYYSRTYGESDLDHALASKELSFLTGKVTVRGWVDKTSDDDRLDFVDHISDHASIELTVFVGGSGTAPVTIVSAMVQPSPGNSETITLSATDDVDLNGWKLVTTKNGGTTTLSGSMRAGETKTVTDLGTARLGNKGGGIELRNGDVVVHSVSYEESQVHAGDELLF